MSETVAAAERAKTIERLLKGAIDLHCHSGPSVMSRDLDHIEALREASTAGFRAVLFKDHFYSVDPVAELLRRHYGHLGVELLSGIALNNAVGGFNCHAVDHSIKLGGRIVWMPTFSAANHIDQHRKDANFGNKFPSTRKRMLKPVPLRALDDNGNLLDEVKIILDLIAEADLVLSAGHLHISEIWPLFEEAQRRGVRRFLVNHPIYVVGVEHSACMFVDGSKFKLYDPATLDALIKAGTVDRTILGSDLGQTGNPRPVDGFRAVIGMCLDLGYSEDDIRKMVSRNAARLFGLSLDDERSENQEPAGQSSGNS
jgi:hypothetical protein